MRKPIHQELRGLQTPRERIWRAVLASPKEFTRQTVQDMCEPMVRLSAVDDYFDGLIAAGILVRVGGGEPVCGSRRSEYTYRAARRPFEAPRLARSGAEVSMGTANTAMWRTMKILKVFDFHEVAKASSMGDLVIKKETAKKYVTALGNAGYLQCVKKAKPGTATLWRLVKNSGPHAPAITRLKAVFDRNTGKFVTLETAQEVCDALPE